MNRVSYTLVRPAATEIAAHRVGDIGIIRPGVLREETGRGHYLSRLTVTALRHLNLHPGSLNGMTEIARQPFNCSYLLTRSSGNRGDTGTNCFTVKMHGAAAADRHAATILGSGES